MGQIAENWHFLSRTAAKNVVHVVFGVVCVIDIEYLHVLR